MGNLQFLTNVTHNGVIFKGTQVTTDKTGAQRVIPGVIVDLEADTRGLKAVKQNLIDRGLAKETNDPATHTSNFVSQSQEAIPVASASGAGQSPSADTIRQQDEQRKQQEADKARSAAEVKQAELQKAQADAAKANAAAGQPTPEQIAAAAASAN